MADPLSIASGIAGLVAIADTIFGRVYSYVRAVKGAAKEIEQLACEIRNLSGILHGLELVLNELLRDSAEPNLRLHHVNSCRATLLKIRNKLDSPATTASQNTSLPNTARFVSTLQKIKWPFSRSETSELLAEIERHKLTINVAVSGDSLATVVRALSRQDKIADDIETIKSFERDRSALEKRVAMTGKRKEVLGFFEKVDSSTSHYANLKLRHPLTGLWLTEGTTFKTWLHTRGSKLWLSGIPGAGKTVLAACAIEEAIIESSATQAVAYFYCDYQQASTGDPVNILGSLAAQMAKHDEAAFLHLQELYEKFKPEDGVSVPLGISDLVQGVQLMASCFEDVSVIIDGLDECGDRTSEVLSALTSLTSVDSSNVRSILFSRNEHAIQQLLREEYNHMEIAAHTEDLELYVAAELESRQRKHGRERLRIRNPEVKDYLKKILVERADGMFRWVACQLDLLCGLPNDTAMRKALDSLPPTLFKTYEKLLERVNTRHSSVKQMVQRALRWIVHGKEPLSIAALCEAISIQDDDKTLDDGSICEEEDILVHCSSLIRRTADGENLELAHFTVKEFLESLPMDADSPLASYSQYEEHVIPYLAKTCLTFLTFEDFQGPVIEDWDKWEAQQSQYPFRLHAVEFWDQYVEDAGLWENKILFSWIQNLFNSSKKSCFRAWIRDFVYGNVYVDWGINLFNDSDDYPPYELDRANFEVSTRFMCKGGITPLHIAAALGSRKLCELLLDSGSNISQMSSLGAPIHCALAGFRNLGKPLGTDWEHSDTDPAGARRGKVVEFLIQSRIGLPTSYSNHLGKECSWSKLAILSGIGSGRQHVLVTLVNAGAKLDKGGLIGLAGWDQLDAIGFDRESLEALLTTLKETGQDDEAWSDLLHAAIPLDTPIPTDLLRDRTTLSTSVEELNELLHDAIRFDNVEAITFLSNDHRLDLRAGLSGMEDPLIHIAVSSNSLGALETLLSLGLEIDIANEYGKTALHLAAEDELVSRLCISILLDHRASTTVVDQRGYSVWHVAAYSDNKTAIQILLNRDIDAHKAQLLPDRDGYVPLFAAAYSSQPDAFKILLLHFENLEHFPQLSPEGYGLVHYAVRMNSFKLLKLLKTKDFDLSQRTDVGRTAFHFLPYEVDSEILELLIESGVDPSTPAHDGATPLHTLMERVTDINDEIFKILATETTVNAMTHEGKTPLHFITNSIDGNEMYYPMRSHFLHELVLAKGANIHALDKAGRSCLWMLFEAIEIRKLLPSSSPSQRRALVDFVASILELITEPAVLHQPILWEGKTCSLVNWAICRRCDDLVEILLSKGFDVDLKMGTPGGSIMRSAVETACSYGCNLGCLRILLERSARLFEPDEEGLYIPHQVCAGPFYHDSSLLEQLCEYGLDWNRRADISSKTPIMLAARNGKQDHVRFLLQHGVDLRAKESYNWQALHWASLSTDPLLLKHFIGRDVDWNAQVNFHSKGEFLGSCGVLHLATVKENPETVRLIVQESLVEDINVLNGNGLSPLHIAASHGNAQMVEILVLAGANIDLKCPRSDIGIRPIHSAISHGARPTTEALLRHGCSLAPDERGMTLKQYALKHKQTEIISILEKYISKQEQRDHLIIGESNQARPSAVASPQDLDFAIDAGDLGLCRAIIESGKAFSQHQQKCTSCSPLQRALLKNQPHIAAYLVEKGVAVGGQLCSGSSFRGYSAIHLASHQGLALDPRLLNLLLIKDRQLGYPSFRTPVSPIHVAVGSRYHAALRLLLQHGQKQDWIAPRKATDGELTSSDTFSTSIYTSRDADVPWKGSSFLCDVMFDSDNLDWDWELSSWQPDSPEPLTTAQIKSGSPLHIAAYLDDLKSTETLLEFGALADSSDREGNTPMHIAAESGSLRIVSLLVQHGANPNALNVNGATAAMLAAKECHVKTVKHLTTLTHYAVGPNYCDLCDLSILHQAVYSLSKSCAEMVSYLLLLGCDPNLKDSDNKTSFEVGLWETKGQTGVPSLMLNWDLDFQLCAGILSELSLGRISNSTMRRLLKRLPEAVISLDINKISPYGRRGTLLTQAAIIDDPKLLDILICAGATVDLEGSAGGTPLLVACTGGRFSSVKYLVRIGANLFGTRNRVAVSAIRAAKAFPHIVRWLLVERYIDQRKIGWSPCGDIDQEAFKWSGPTTVEVPTLGLYSPWHGASSFEKAVELAQLKKRIQGCVVHY